MKHAAEIVVVCGLGACLFSGCAGLDPQSVRAKAGAPEAARVEELAEIPYDATRPRYLLVVEPLQYRDAAKTWSRNERVQSTDSKRRQFDSHEHEDQRLRANAKVTTGSLKSDFSPQKPNQEAEPVYPQGAIKMPDLQTAAQVNSNASGEVPTQGSLDKTKAELNGELHRERWSQNASSESSRSDWRKQSSGQDSELSFGNRAVDMSFQLVSALKRVKNFSVTPVSADILNQPSLPRAQKGEAGPFVVRIAVTESEARSMETKKKIHLGAYSSSSGEIQGVFGVDVQVLEVRSNRVVAAFPVQATYSSAEATRSTGYLGVYGSKQFAQSIIDQASRMAMNQVAERLYRELDGVR